METKVGIKETTDMIIALNEIALTLIKVFKDGFKLESFVELWNIYQNDEDLKNKIKAGYDNYQLIPEEISDIDLMESLKLMTIQIEYAQKIIKELKLKPEKET